MTVYFARKEYVYSGGDAIFSIPFSYIKKEHISVLVNDEATENYTYLNNSQIQVNDTLETNDVVSIIRSTPIDSRMVVFSDTSILDKKAQNLAQEQVFDAIQEVYDNNIKFNIDTLDILEANKEELEQNIANNKQELLGIQSSFESEVTQTIADNKQEVLDIQADFKQEVNTTIETVKEAAEKINNLEQAVEEAKTAAQTATSKADETQEVLVNAVTEMDSKLATAESSMDSKLSSATATMNEKLSAANTAVENAMQQANLATQKAQEILDINPANTNLSNLTEAGLKVIKDNSGSGLEVCDIGMALYVDETKGLRRYLNGQIVDINTNTQAFLDRLLQIQTTNPEYFTTEDNWQAEATLNIDGCVYKFVLNYSGDNVVSVRLPKYPDYIEVSAGNTATTAPIKELGLVPQQGYGITEGGMYWIPAKLTNVGSTDKVNASCKLLSQDGSGAVWLGEIKSGAKGNYFSGYADLSGLNIKQTKLKMRYFIQIATGSETENNIINDIELNNPYSLFDFKWTDHKLNNVSWVASLNQWNNKTTYPDAYNELLIEFNNTESTEETSNGVTYKRTPNGYLIATVDQETAIDSLYNSTGVAWIYLLDTTNQRFKLPRTRYGFVGLRNIVGNYISESLPNITGSINGAYNSDNVTGAFRFTTTMSSQSSTTPNLVGGFTFDASRVSSTYQNNAPVQQRATEMYLYFYVGETVQNANLIDAGRIGEQLATKASVNDIDGAFVKAELVLVDGTTYTVGTTYETKTLVQFDISNYLPEDSDEYDYEVRLSSEGYATNTSTMLWINTPSVADISYGWSPQVNTSCGSVGSVVTQIIPKGYKKASIYLRSGSSSMQFYSHIVGYRRLRKGA